MKKQKYDRDTIIRKLEKKGLKAKYCQGSKILSHFEAPHWGANLGIKSLGYLDFLDVSIVKLAEKKRKQREKSKIKPRPRAWSFAWFPIREEADIWLKKQAMSKRLDIYVQKSNTCVTEDGDIRACLEGIQINN